MVSLRSWFEDLAEPQQEKKKLSSSNSFVLVLYANSSVPSRLSRRQTIIKKAVACVSPIVIRSTIDDSMRMCLDSPFFYFVVEGDAVSSFPQAFIWQGSATQLDSHRCSRHSPAMCFFVSL